MKITAPENPNYVATIVKLLNIVPLENCDNVVGTTIFNSQAIVGNHTKKGEVGVVFQSGTRLSEEYCKENNLFRHAELNKDKSVTGYIEDNRRVKAMKFRGNRSDALFMPLESLKFTKVNIDELHEGDAFDNLNGHEICKKYINKVPRPMRNVQERAFRRVEEKFLPEHYDTENFFRNQHKIKPGTFVTVTQKLHGTSIRIGNTVVIRKMKLADRIAKKLGVNVQLTEFDHVSGSKKVIKDPNNPFQSHYYDTDVWTTYGQKLKGLVPENVVIYAELIGYSESGTPLQPKYTYCVPDNTADMYVYRVAVVTAQGRIYDMAWPQVKEFCTDIGVKTVPELWSGPIEELTKIVRKKDNLMFIAKKFLDTRYVNDGFTQAVPLGSDMSLVDEGVCVRVDKRIDGKFPYVLKAKSPIFNAYEDKLADDSKAVDMEAVGGETI